MPATSRKAHGRVSVTHYKTGNRFFSIRFGGLRTAPHHSCSCCSRGSTLPYPLHPTGSLCGVIAGLAPVEEQQRRLIRELQQSVSQLKQQLGGGCVECARARRELLQSSLLNDQLHRANRHLDSKVLTLTERLNALEHGSGSGARRAPVPSSNGHARRASAGGTSHVRSATSRSATQPRGASASGSVSKPRAGWTRPKPTVGSGRISLAASTQRRRRASSTSSAGGGETDPVFARQVRPNNGR